MKVFSLLFIFTFPFLCQSVDVPATGPGMAVDLDMTFGLAENGITATAAMGAVAEDSYIHLPVGASSKLIYRGTFLGGLLAFNGGILLSKSNAKVTLTNFVLDIGTGIMTASLDQVRVVFVEVQKVAAVLKTEGSTSVEITLSHVTIETGVAATIGQKFGLALTQHYEATASISFDVNLANGNQLNMDLIYALKLDKDIRPNMSVDEFSNLMYHMEIDFQ